MLKCEVGSGISFIVSSTRDMHCVFHKNDGQTEAYGGKIHSFGLEVGVSAAAVIVWAVAADTVDLPPGELSGRYGGAEAGGTVIVGASARVLVGGSRKTISLQPVSIEAGVGLNLAVGVAQMDLYPLFRVPTRPVATRAPAVGIAHPAEHRTSHHQHYGCGSYIYAQSSDTVYRISQKCGVSVGAILNANPDIGDTYSLRAGQIVHIPSHVSAHRSNACAARATLQPGESLDDVAARCGVTLHALLRANPDLRDLEVVRAGYAVNIPRRQAAPVRSPIRVVHPRPAPQPVAVQPAAMSATGPDPSNMEDACSLRAASSLGAAPGTVVVRYQGQRSDRTHAVNGSAEVGGREQTFQCSFNPAGTRIAQFVVNRQATPQRAAAVADISNMQNMCVARAANALGVPAANILIKYEGQRTDQTHAVNGSAATRGGERTFQCSYNAAGARMINFVVNPAPRNTNAQQTAPVAAARASSAERAGRGQFDATGPMPCAQAPGQPMVMGQCNFGVARDGGGSATVAITRPDGRKRFISFTKGRAISADISQADGDVQLRSVRRGDTTDITIGNERYEIIDAVLFGG